MEILMSDISSRVLFLHLTKRKAFQRKGKIMETIRNYCFINKTTALLINHSDRKLLLDSN